MPSRGGFAVRVAAIAARGGVAKHGNNAVDGSKAMRNAGKQGSHTTLKADANGNVTEHAAWKPNPQNPRNGFEQVKRVDTQYANPHTHVNKKTEEEVLTPHTHDKTILVELGRCCQMNFQIRLRKDGK